MAMGVTRSGSGFCFFGSSLYAYLCGVKICNIDIPDEEVPDTNVRTLIQKVDMDSFYFKQRITVATCCIDQ